MQRIRTAIPRLLPSLIAASLGLSLGMLAAENRQVKAEQPFSFQNVAEEAGLEAPFGAWGAAWVDYDSDAVLDRALFAGRGNFQLWRNKGDGTFADVTKTSGIVPPHAFTVGGAFADYDSDGCPDLYLAIGDEESHKEDRLYRNTCEGTFVDVTQKAGIANSSYGIGAAWGDYDRDGDLDLYVSNWGSSAGGERVEEPNVLWRNNGDGTFTNVASELGVEGVSSSCWGTGDFPGDMIDLPKDRGLWKVSFQPVWFDYDNDRDLDLFVATEETPSPLYRNLGNGTFEEVTRKAGLCVPSTNMGVAVGDYDNNGWLDLYVTNEGPNFLWGNNKDGTFVQRAGDLGVEDGRALGWGTEFLDYDNDGWLDLYVANGTLGERQILLRFDRFYKNGKGKFTDATARYLKDTNIARRAFAVGDYDNNGFLDMFVSASPFAHAFEHRLYKNPGNGNNWLTIVLEGNESNREGIGARIVLKAGGLVQIREVRSGSSYASQSSLWQTFGLGKASLADKIEVLWPSGKNTVLENVEANQRYTIEEGANERP